MRSRRRWAGRIAYGLFLLLLALGTAEITLRATGHSPWTPSQSTIEIEPAGSFFRPDPLLGYAGRPGTLHVTLRDTLSFTVSHDAQGYRFSAPPNDTTDNRPEIWIFGCSFTHGYGVNDHETFPWHLQKAFPQLAIRNYAMDGYGTYHSLLQLRQLRPTEKVPAQVILAYGAFHDQRNVNSRFWKKALSGQEIAEKITYPFVRLDKNDSLVTYMEPPAYDPWPGQTWSALVHFLEQRSNNGEDRALQSKAVTRRLIGEIEGECREMGVPLAVVGIFQNAGTEEILQEWGGRVDTLNVAVDTEDPGLRILPEDGHPNAKGHRMMADQLIPWLEGKLKSGG